MLNVVSTAASNGGWGGATKVYRNLVKGLQVLGYPYVVNRDLDSTQRLWIHSDVFALPGLKRTRAKAVLGPNLFVMPSDMPKGIDFSDALYLQPSEWVVRLWRHVGFDACDLTPWPVGVDTDVFTSRSRDTRALSVLVYFKRRRPAELDAVTQILDRIGLANRVLHYGSYTEEGYRAALASTSFVIWLGCPESQGLALQEALACDVPVLVWDATRLEQASQVGMYVFNPSLGDFPVTSAPYFDESCGLRIADRSELPDAIARMREAWQGFGPRAFVLQHLSLAGQARAFLHLWTKKWGLASEGGLLGREDRSEPLRHRPLETLVFRWRRRFGPKWTSVRRDARETPGRS